MDRLRDRVENFKVGQKAKEVNMLSTQMKQSFIDNGYFIAEDIIPKTLIEDMCREAKLLATAEEADQKVFLEEVYCGDWWLYMPNRSEYPSFKYAAEFPHLIDLVNGILNSDSCQVMCSALMRISPSQGGTGWHQDLDVPSEAKVGLTFHLYEVSNGEGQIRVVPGSHKWEASVDFLKNEPHPDELRLNISKKKVIFQQKKLWHTASANLSNIDNWLLILYYGVRE